MGCMKWLWSKKKEWGILFEERKTTDKEETLRMQTNEKQEKALMQRAENQRNQFLKQLEKLKEGDLKSVEELVRSTINAMGCQMMETLLSAKTQEQPPTTKREGSCGHTMRLVGMRGKRLQTLMGPITLWRPYYHCAGTSASEEEQSAEGHHAAHGEAPADELWGVQQHRCSVGVQQAISRFCAGVTLEEAAETLQALFPVAMSARQALNLIQPVGEALKKQEEEQQQEIFKQAGDKRSQPEAQDLRNPPAISRLDVEIDGVLARLRRGSVPLARKGTKASGRCVSRSESWSGFCGGIRKKALSIGSW